MLVVSEAGPGCSIKVVFVEIKIYQNSQEFREMTFREVSPSKNHEIPEKTWYFITRINKAHISN